METMQELRKKAKELNIAMPFGTTKEGLAKAVIDAESKLLTPSITVTERVNPELTQLNIMNSVVSETETEAQRRYALEKEIRDKIEREEIEKRLRREAQLLARKKAQLDKYKLNYDLADMREQCTRLAAASGCQFVIDTQLDGSLAGTFHIFGAGKAESGTLAQPLEIILRTIRIFCKTATTKDYKTHSGFRSALDGAQIAIPVTIGGEKTAADIAYEESLKEDLTASTEIRKIIQDA